MDIGFTGTQTGPMSRKQVYTVIELLSEFRDGSMSFHHGCCVGWDDKAARIAKVLSYELVGHPPLNRSKMGLVKNDRNYAPANYLQRNYHIVNMSRLLIAVPRTHHEELRSGTWATIRYANKYNKPGLIVWPDGELDHIAEIIGQIWK